MIWLLLAGCATQEPHYFDLPAAEHSPLEGALLARRVSLDLRGVLPTATELDLADSDAAAWMSLRDEWMEEEGFEDRLVALLHERWRTRVDVFDIVFQDYGLSADDEFAFERSVGEEPLRLLAHVITEDLPWSEAVTADYTMANETLAELWPLDYPEGASGWQKATYTDGRPAGGVLVTNGLWWRYTTTTSNMNRGRAAAISRLLLCEDYLTRPITFSENDEISNTTEALRSDPYCLGCHSSIDPIAATLFGFWWLSLYSDVEENQYHPEREPLGPDYIGLEPAWYGAPMNGLADLGWHVASDARMYDCAVQSMAELLWRRPTDPADKAVLDSLRRDFLTGGAIVRPLIADLTETDAYRVGRLADGATELDEDRETTRRMLSPAQLETAVEELTGWRWSSRGFDQLANDTYGYRVLAGGIDGVTVNAPQTQPGLTWALVVKRVAQGAASHVVSGDLVDGGALLFTAVDLDDRPGDDAFTEELQQLHWRLYAVPADDVWVAGAGELWAAVEAEEGAEAAWTSTLSVMLRDPLFVTY